MDLIGQVVGWVDAVAPIVLAVAALVWLALMVALLAGRLRHDHYQLKFRIVERRIADGGDAETILSRIPAAVIAREASDPATSGTMAGILSRHFMERVGPERLFRAASDGHNDRRRIRALRLLARAGYPALLELMDKALHSGREEVIDAVVSMLGTLEQEGAARLLVVALRERLFPMSRIATELEHFRLEIPHIIRPLLDAPNAGLRYWGAALASRYVYVAGFADALLRLTRDQAPNVRKAAIQSLRHSSIPGVEREAARLTADPVYYVRVHAARTLAASRDTAVSQHIVPLLGDPNWWVRLSARESLASLGPAVVPAVLPLLESSDPAVAEGVAQILHNVGYVDEMVRRVARHREQVAVTLFRPLVAAGGEAFTSTVLARYSTGEIPALGRVESALRRLTRQ